MTTSMTATTIATAPPSPSRTREAGSISSYLASEGGRDNRIQNDVGEQWDADDHATTRQVGRVVGDADVLPDVVRVTEPTQRRRHDDVPVLPGRDRAR